MNILSNLFFELIKSVLVLFFFILIFINKKIGSKQSLFKYKTLDAEKAFDRVWRDGLFFKLLPKLHITYWFIIKKYYDSSKGIIIEDGHTHPEFNITCGVKQGGILSPFLFNIFIDNLITECLNKNIGALFKSINISIVAYADDIILLSPADKQLKILLDTCASFSEKWKLKFNANKSHIIKFGKNLLSDDSLHLDNIKLKYSDTWD